MKPNQSLKTLINAITLDGSVATGKDTVTAIVEKNLGVRRLNSGILYRAVTFCAMNGTPEPLDALARIDYNDGQLLIDKKPAVDELLRTPEVTRKVPLLAAIYDVRKGLLPLMKKFGEGGNFIAEGRDMGSSVFPNARLKFFLDAKPEIRAKRRFDQLLQKGYKEVTYEEVLRDLIERDDKDRTRPDSPLVKADDAILISVDTMSAHQVADIICMSWRSEN